MCRSFESLVVRNTSRFACEPFGVLICDASEPLLSVNDSVSVEPPELRFSQPEVPAARPERYTSVSDVSGTGQLAYVFQTSPCGCSMSTIGSLMIPFWTP